MKKRDNRERVHLGGTYRLMLDGIGLNFKVLMRTGPLWRVVWLNGTGKQEDIATVTITACSKLLRPGQPMPAYPQ